MAGFQKYMFEGVLAVLAIGCLIVAVSSKKRASELKVEATMKNARTGRSLMVLKKLFRKRIR